MIGRLIKSLRKNEKMTQIKLAKKVKLTQGYFSKLEIEMTQLDFTFIRVCREFRLDPFKLLEFEESKSQPLRVSPKDKVVWTLKSGKVFKRGEIVEVVEIRNGGTEFRFRRGERDSTSWWSTVGFALASSKTQSLRRNSTLYLPNELKK